MKRSIPIGLTAVTVAGAVLIATLASPVAPPVEAREDASPGKTLVHLELRILEVKGDALRESGVRIGTLGGESEPGTAVDPKVLLARTDGRGGITVLVDQAFTLEPETKVVYRAGMAMPTTTTTLASGGVAMEGFQGYETGGVTLVLRTSSPENGRVLVDVEYGIDEFVGEGRDGIPPARMDREGRFAAPVPLGKTSFQGGMIRVGVESTYLLFFLEATLVD